MDINLARVNRIPADWGLEVGVLAEVYRNSRRGAGLPGGSDRQLRAQAPDAVGRTIRPRGLRRMACDIAKSLFRTLAGEGVVFTADHFRSLEVRYVRMAEDTIARYYADAMLNGLKFDRHAEEMAVATFARSLRPGRRRVPRRSARTAADPQLEPGAGGDSGVLRPAAGCRCRRTAGSSAWRA